MVDHKTKAKKLLKLNYEEIDMLAQYIDNKIYDSETMGTIFERLKKSKTFRETYVNVYEFLKNIKCKKLYRIENGIKKV